MTRNTVLVGELLIDLPPEILAADAAEIASYIRQQVTAAQRPDIEHRPARPSAPVIPITEG